MIPENYRNATEPLPPVEDPEKESREVTPAFSSSSYNKVLTAYYTDDLCRVAAEGLMKRHKDVHFTVFLSTMSLSFTVQARFGGLCVERSFPSRSWKTPDSVVADAIETADLCVRELNSQLGVL